MKSLLRNRLALLLLVVALVGGGVAGSWLWFHRAQPLPGPETATYQEYLRSFQVGVAALEIGRVDVAGAKLDQAIKLIPQEPAAWADRGIMYLRLNDLDQAARDLKQAKKLAPNSGEIEALLGLLDEKRGRSTEAVAHFRAALSKDPHDLPTLFTLAEAISRAAGPDSDVEYQRLLEQILELQPNNLPVLTRQARAAYQSKDKAAFDRSLARFDRLASGWSDPARNELAKLHKAIKDNPSDVVTQLTFLDNVLMGERGYKRDSLAISPLPGSIGSPILTFLALQPAKPTPAPPDRELAFSTGSWAADKPVKELERSRWDVIRPVWFLGENSLKTLVEAATTGGLRPPPVAYSLAVFVANASEVRRADVDAPPLPCPGGAGKVAPTAAGVLAVDWNNDYRSDLILAGAGGLRFWQQKAGGSFIDMTEKTGLSAEVLKGDYYGAWAADIEMDGDLDIIVARRTGAPLLLRNNGDGTFKASDAFTTVKGARAFVWADLDNDGAPDAAFLDAAGKLHVFGNDRAGQFSPWPLPDDLGKFVALTAADVNDDGILDLVALRSDGVLLRLSDQDKRKSWQTAEIARWPGPTDLAPGAVTLLAEDFDNNGAPDLVVAGPREAHVYLAVGEGRYEMLPDALPLHGFTALDLEHNGRLDLLGLSAAGQPAHARNRGKKAYHSIALRPLANPKAGDARINSFAIGGEMEIRAGSLVHKQTINSPIIHFGLGEQKEIDVARIVWPNGAAQWELDLKAEPVLLAAQRLVGSCPFLFTDDGNGMHFVTDFMWSTPLGMYVNGQHHNTYDQTTDWVKIAGSQLVERDGRYDIRVNANLWETDFFDKLALLTVDHPADTEIHLDERFFLTPRSPELAERLHVTTPAKPVAQAWDHHGRDATDLVRAIDGRYLDRCGRGHYQGVTSDHWVEADLGDDAPKEGPILLVARGWIHPTDSSINVALEQGTHDRPSPLVLEVPDGHGGWKVGRPALGFPAGKNKTMLIRLDGIDGKGVSRRFRLRTNMEIYWDFLGYARELDPKLARLQQPTMETADLHYRGVLEMTQKDASCPEVPHYERVLPGVQPWRDLVGTYTRFGDVKELLAQADDRYVIMNAGDEIALRFTALAAPPAGQVRDYIWECAGWTKDGNPNTRFGTTVLPLPARGLRLEEKPTGRLEDDPVYRRFPKDWVTYHTRYVTADQFERGLRTFRQSAER